MRPIVQTLRECVKVVFYAQKARKTKHTTATNSRVLSQKRVKEVHLPFNP